MNGAEWHDWIARTDATAALLERMMQLIAVHPDLEVHAPIATGSRWTATWPEGSGSTTVTRYALRELLDEAEARLAALAAKRKKEAELAAKHEQDAARS